MADRKPRRTRETAGARTLSRRRFMALLAGGALAATPARAVTIRRPAARATRKPPVRSAAIEKGIAEQKTALTKQLATLRRFSLPTGSDPAFLFRPLSPRRIR
jgi:hypothetical protein